MSRTSLLFVLIESKKVLIFKNYPLIRGFTPGHFTTKEIFCCKSVEYQMKQEKWEKKEKRKWPVFTFTPLEN